MLKVKSDSSVCGCWVGSLVIVKVVGKGRKAADLASIPVPEYQFCFK
jgi:hypothetical protein